MVEILLADGTHFEVPECRMWEKTIRRTRKSIVSTRPIQTDNVALEIDTHQVQINSWEMVFDSDSSFKSGLKFITSAIR